MSSYPAYILDVQTVPVMFIIVLNFNTDIISVMLSESVLCSADTVIGVMTTVKQLSGQ